MDPTASSSTSGRCGMCGSCGAMPPWAPEMLKNVSPEARHALERRMMEAQKRFIEERDAKKKATETIEDDHFEIERDPSSRDSPNGDEIQLSSNHQPELSDGYPAQRNAYKSDGEQIEDKVSELTPEESAEEPEKLAMRQSNNEFLVRPQIEADVERGLETPNALELSNADVHVEENADIEIPLDSVGVPPLPPASSGSQRMETLNPPHDESHVLRPPRRKLPPFSSPALQESPAPPETPELQPLTNIVLEPNQLSEPLRTISLRDTDSDADSFHTAEGEEFLRRSSDRLSTKLEEEPDNNVAPIVSETEWQAFQDGEVGSQPALSAPKVSESPVTESAISVTDEEVLLEEHTADATHSKTAFPKPESFASEPSISLEDSVATSRKVTRGPSSPQAQRDALMEDYALPSDLVRPNDVNLQPQSCQDCERWRERVRELELKVEALTSALNAREMESASMRAHSVDRRHHGKNEAQLIQECESLRITTEFLYYKLEQYERKLNGSHPDVH